MSQQAEDKINKMKYHYAYKERLYLLPWRRITQSGFEILKFCGETKTVIVVNNVLKLLQIVLRQKSDKSVHSTFVITLL